jgi:hypothetical protein
MTRKNLNPYGYGLSPAQQRTSREAFDNLDAVYKAEEHPEPNIPDSYTWISAQVSNPRLRILLNDLHNSFWELQDREDTEKMFRIIRQTFINTVNKGWHKGLWSQQERDEAINWGGQEAKEFIESIRNTRHSQDQPHYY